MHRNDDFLLEEQEAAAVPTRILELLNERTDSKLSKRDERRTSGQPIFLVPGAALQEQVAQTIM